MNRICNGGADNKTACFRTDNDVNIKRAKLLGNGFNKRFVCIGILKQCGDIAEEYALFRKSGILRIVAISSVSLIIMVKSVPFVSSPHGLYSGNVCLLLLKNTEIFAE